MTDKEDDASQNVDEDVPRTLRKRFVRIGEAAPLNISTDFWQALEAACDVHLENTIRQKIVAAIHRYIAREVQQTQSGNPRQIDKILSSVENKHMLYRKTL